MTIKRLSKYFYLKKRVENYKKRIEELEKIVLTSANYNQVGNKTSHISPVELKAENLIKLKNLLEKNYYKLVDEELFIENYISKIKDESIKAIKKTS